MPNFSNNRRNLSYLSWIMFISHNRILNTIEISFHSLLGSVYETIPDSKPMGKVFYGLLGNVYAKISQAYMCYLDNFYKTYQSLCLSVYILSKNTLYCL